MAQEVAIFRQRLQISDREISPVYRMVERMSQLVFLSELRQISTKFDNFWHTDSQDNGIM